ncbi:MAG: DNA primase [Planctomycetes bacterium]|nr:DNA primase [Planctomycetota bacterium]
MSGSVGNADIEVVRQSIDLVALVAEQVQLSPKGREHVGLCPFHDDHTPSFAVVTHKGNAFYKCHACGAAGDVFRFVMDFHGMTFPDALRHLADRAGVTLSPRRPKVGTDRDLDVVEIRRANAVAGSFFRQTLKHSADGAAARAMIRDRRISDQMVEAWALGAAPAGWDNLLKFAQSKGLSTRALVAAGLVKPRAEGEGHYDTFRNRLIFPISDDLGRPIAFGGRRLEPQSQPTTHQEPKYLNSSDSIIFRKGRTLYGLHLARRAIIDANQVIVTEGYTDAVACHQAGLRHVVATLGTALTRDHVRILKRLCEVVVLVFDGDEAGLRAADRAVAIFFAEPVDVKICVLGGSLDPAAVLAEAGGRERMDAALADAQEALAYKVSRFRDRLATASGLSGRQRSLEDLLADLAALGFDAMPGVRKRPVMTQLADLLGLRIEDIDQAMRRLRRPAAGPAGERFAAAGQPISQVPPETEPADERQEAACTPARRRAEQELLGVLIYQPSLRTQPVAGPDGRALPVTRLIRPEEFRDPAAGAIAEIVFGWLDDEVDFSMGQLMGRLESPGLRSLAAELYDEARRRCGGERPAADVLCDAGSALAKLLGREQFKQDLDAYRESTPQRGRRASALHDILEKRRKQGYIPEAMPSRLRT